MKKPKSPPIQADIRASLKEKTKGRQWRERETRVGIITSPVKGKNTNAKQWNRWTP